MENKEFEEWYIEKTNQSKEFMVKYGHIVDKFQNKEFAKEAFEAGKEIGIMSKLYYSDGVKAVFDELEKCWKYSHGFAYDTVRTRLKEKFKVAEE